MNQESVAKAKVLLHNVGFIINRIDERDEARTKLQKHIESIQKVAPDNKIKKLHNLIDNLFVKENELMKSNFYETEKVREIKLVLEELRKEHSVALRELDTMKKVSREYEQLKKIQEKREQLLEKKIKKKELSEIKKAENEAKKAEKQDLRDHIKVLEDKYKEYRDSKTLTKAKLATFKKRIDKLKKELKEL
ncbi:hypothetical protein KY321_02490 [Candidatus Woesearchaeota archaeon]|nr:hypothetical protein [Candidatus Woesearchaeota archaeon]